MPSLPPRLFGLVLASAFVLASPADAAKSRKHKKASAIETASVYYWGTNLVPAGPIYFGPMYLGNDPDPNIRFQIMRDLSVRFGGDSN
jgi:hypothetical protein